MDYLDATQVLEDRRTITENDARQKTIGSLRVGSKEYPITEGLNRIGRSPLCAIVLEDPTVSDVHAEIHAGSEACYVTDLRSVNGTTLKNLQLKIFFFYPINDGDVISFGGVKAVYAKTTKPSDASGIHVTKTPVSTTGGLRESTFSTQKHDFSREEPNDSIVPSSQRHNRRRSLFRRPEMSLSARQKNAERIIELVEEFKRIDKTQNAEDSQDIYNVETQKMDLPEPAHKNTRTERPKRANEADQSPKDPAGSDDIHNMETQEMFNRSSFVTWLTKRPRSQNWSNDDPHPDDHIFEAATQVSIAVEESTAKMPFSAVVDHEDSDDETQKREAQTNECQIIAETDDERNELSDESITDNENEFAALHTKVSNNGKTETNLSDQQKRSNLEFSAIEMAATQLMKDLSPRRRACSSTRRAQDDEDIDLDLMPTQVLDVATSTPMSRPSKISLDDEFDESAPVIDYHDIHTALTQVDPEKDREIVDSRSPEKCSPRRKSERCENPDATINSTGDGVEKKLGNIFGNETTSDVERADESTQLMTQNLVDILKMTQNSFREAATTPAVPAELPVPGTSNNVIAARKSASPDNRNRKEASEIIGFLDGRAVGSNDELQCPSTSASVTAKDQEIASSASRTPSRQLRSDDNDGNGDGNDNDDVLAGLPEFKIDGTCSNPRSPDASENSSGDESLALTTPGKAGNAKDSNKEKKAIRLGKSRTPERFAAIAKLNKTPEPDSPILTKKSRSKRKISARNRITDDENDSEDDLDYNDLKTIADRLLASTSTNNTEQVGRAGVGKSRDSSVAKADATEKKVVTRGRPTRQLSETPSSLNVTDTTYSEHSANETRKSEFVNSSMTSSKRPRVTARKARANKRRLSREGLEGPAAKRDKPVAPQSLLVKCKSHAKVQLTRINEVEVRIKRDKDIQSDLDASKVTRSRRSTPRIAADSKASPTLPVSRVKSRKTIGPIVSSPARNGRHKILFTGIKDEDYERMVVQLGGVVIEDPSQATVLVTDKVRRTFKFLCAVAQGTKIVSERWLIESNDAGHFLDCDSFILQDPAAENKFKFKLAKSLNVAKTKKLLDGFTLIVTPKVNQPEVHELKGMAEACGGRVLVRAGRSWDEKTVIISREDDLATAKTLLSKVPKSLRITVQSTEFLLTGILRQEINLVDHKLL